MELIKGFLLPLPNEIMEDEAIKEKLENHYKESYAQIEEKLPEMKQKLRSLEAEYEKKSKKVPEDLKLLVNAPYQKTIYKVFFYKCVKMRSKLLLASIEQQKHAILQVSHLKILLEYLKHNTRPLAINVKKAIPKATSKTFLTHQKVYLKYRAINMARKEFFNYMNNMPYITNSILARQFMRNLIDNAMTQRKANTSYFESPANEEELFKYMDHPYSPLSKEKLVPIQIDLQDEEAITNWISSAVSVLSSVDGIPIQERRDVLTVFMTRYLFERTYPALQLEDSDNPKLTKVRMMMLQKTPEEAHIPLKYVTPKLRDRPVKELFEASSISSAPVQWMDTVQFKVCPLDIAYCIFKVHESLSIMATLTATENSAGETSEDFFSKMPGFDDIFDLWQCLVCASSLPDPRGVANYLGTWAGLPGFPQRFVACCTYLEAAVSQLEEASEKL